MTDRAATSEIRRSHLANAESLKIALKEADVRIARMEETSQHQEAKREAELLKDQQERGVTEETPLILDVFERRAEKKRRCVLTDLVT